jgi:hypothetical protein
VQQSNVEAEFILLDEPREAWFMMRCEQRDPGCCHRLVKDVRDTMVRGVPANTFPYGLQSLIEGLAVQLEPRQSQVISMAEAGKRQLATREGREEVFVAQVSGSEHDSHGQNFSLR